jgi:lipid A 3-O-deacylase
MPESKDLVNFAVPMKNCLYFILFLFLFTRCDLTEPKNHDKEWIRDVTKLTPSETIINKSHNQDSISYNPKSTKEYKVKSFIRGTKKKKWKIKITNPNLIKRSGTIDSLRVTKLRLLRKEKIDIDLNEAVNKDFLLSSTENEKFSSMILLSREKFLKISFDNDILDYTDRFYTNGIRFEYINPIFQQFPLTKLMVPYWRSGTNYYGISLVQNMYTPSTTKVEGIIFGDRPYAAYLYFGTFKITNDPVKKFRQTSELDIGVIGSYSFGEYIQESFHSEVPTNSPPLGWEYQIKNDIVLNYHLSIEKGLYNRKNFDLNLNGTGSLGSLYTNISGGFLFRVGIQNPYFTNLGQSKRKTNKENKIKNTQFIFFLSSRGKLIGYDATLQGGFFNKSSEYTISSQNISRIVFQGSAGITFVYSGVRFDIEQFLLSPEFHNGWWHKWVHLAFTFSL